MGRSLPLASHWYVKGYLISDFQVSQYLIFELATIYQVRDTELVAFDQGRQILLYIAGRGTTAFTRAFCSHRLVEKVKYSWKYIPVTYVHR